MTIRTAAMHTLAAVVVFGAAAAAAAGATGCDACKQPASTSGSAGSSASAGPTGSAGSAGSAAAAPDAAVRPPPALDAAAAAAPQPDARVFAPTPVTVEEATALLPTIDGRVLVAPRAIAGGQVHAAWCIAGADADAVAHALADRFAAGSWLDVSSRGDATKAGVSGHRDRYTLSIVVSSSAALTCPAPGHYMAAASIFETPH